LIFSYFDSAYYINLSHRKDRREQFERRSKEAGFEAERFEAICPAPIPASQTTDEREHFKLGCTLSHHGCIRLAQERQQERVLIFEDDSVFVPDFATKFLRYVEELKTIENWSLFFLGGSPEPDYNNPGGVCEQITPNIYLNPGAIWGTHAYAINSRFYSKILAIKSFPTDVAFISCPDRRYLMTGDLLVYQDSESFSDLWGQTFDRDAEYQKNYQKYIR